MIYRGYYIGIVNACGLLRHNFKEDRIESCDGVYVEFYDQADDGYSERIGDTAFAVGYEISDRSEKTVEQAIREYVDDHIMELDCVRNEVHAERKNLLVGRLVSWIGEEETGVELYNTLSENIGMTDDEIRQCGFKSLVPYFDREAYAQTIADHMIFVGTDNTTTGNWHFTFEEIGERFGLNLSEDTEMLDMITEELYKQGDVVSEVGVYCNEFDLTFYLNYCPYSDRGEVEDVVYDQQI